jgi:hypothetical protein
VKPCLNSLLDYAQHAILDVRHAALQELIARLAKMDISCPQELVRLAVAIVKHASLLLFALHVTQIIF